MAFLLPIGVFATLTGLVGLGYCIWQATKTKDLDDEAAKAHLQRLVAWNLGSVGLAGLGLMVVIIGLVLR